MEKSDLLFWTDIMSDHGEFLSKALSSKEEKCIDDAIAFKNIFQQHRSQIDTNNYGEVNLENDIKLLILYKKSLVLKLLQCEITISFPPSFINHMINEASEFSSMFKAKNCSPLTDSPGLYIKRWIADASGHASTIISQLDPAETLLLQNAQYYKDNFDLLYKKCSEIEMIQVNLGVKDYSSLLKSEAIKVIESFVGFCENTIPLCDKCLVLKAGTFNSAVLKHFIKEHLYFIKKVNECLE